MVPGAAMKFEFSNLRVDGEPERRLDILVRVVADFAISIKGEVFYKEVEFCVVEFAVALAEWLAVATDLGPNFSYASIESETQGLVQFKRLYPGAWAVSAAHQDVPASSVSTAELREAAATYLHDLRGALRPRIDILQCIEELKVRQEIELRISK